MRSNRIPNLKFDLTQGVQETGPDLNNRVDEVHGLHMSHVGRLQRIPGKLLMTTSPSSSIWSLAQLRFRDSNVFVEQEGPDLVQYPGSDPLPETIFNLPFPPRVLPQDRTEEDDEDRDWDDLIRSNPWYWMNDRDTELDSAAIVATPDSMTFNEDNWDDPQDTSLTKVWSSDVGFGGMCLVRVTWEAGKDWLTLYDIGETGSVSFQISNGAERSIGFWQDEDSHPRQWRVYVDGDEVPEGGDSATITVQAITMTGRTLRNPDGSPVKEEILINAVKPAGLPDQVKIIITGNLKCVTLNPYTEHTWTPGTIVVDKNDLVPGYTYSWTEGTYPPDPEKTILFKYAPLLDSWTVHLSFYGASEVYTYWDSDTLLGNYVFDYNAFEDEDYGPTEDNISAIEVTEV